MCAWQFRTAVLVQGAHFPGTEESDYDQAIVPMCVAQGFLWRKTHAGAGRTKELPILLGIGIVHHIESSVPP